MLFGLVDDADEDIFQGKPPFVGVDDPKWGQRVVAVVETGPPGVRPSAFELSAFLKERVGGYKVPKEYRFWGALPRTSTGKTNRAEVRLLAERGEDPS